MSYNAKVVLDSISPGGVRLTTLEVTFPRFILAEMNTHRVFSRNSASSRAVPIKKMIERVENDPVYPLEWGSNKPGMQAGELLPESTAKHCKLSWERARNYAVNYAEILSERGAHKQIVNRLLEPFLWHTALITSTEWDNFFEQRLSPNAQPEMQETARQMKAALDESYPRKIPYGAWHAPFLTDADTSYNPTETCIKLSVARCARVSYLNHDGTHDRAKDLKLWQKLYENKHLSPFEHVARPSDLCSPKAVSCSPPNDQANFTGWRQARFNIEQGLALPA